LKLQTKYFGEVEYEEEDVIHFQKGLFAFEDEIAYLLMPFEGSDNTLLCLQSVATPELAFIVMNPFSLDSSYAPMLQPEEITALEGKDSKDFCYYVLCVVKNPVKDSTVNFKCPVVINEDTRMAMQVILETDEYGMRHQLSEFEKGED